MSVTFNGTAAGVLLALWNATKALGFGNLHSHQSPSIGDAEAELKNMKNRIDYFNGKPIKVNFDNFPTLSSGGYDRDAGRGMMQKVADGLAPHIGATVKLTVADAEKLVTLVDSGISFSSNSYSNSNKMSASSNKMSASSNKMSAEEFITWLGTNRPVNCGPNGVDTCIALLMWDIDKGESGLDGSPMPNVNLDEMDKIKAYIISKAEENLANRNQNRKQKQKK